jgi:hypothetical protein
MQPHEVNISWLDETISHEYGDKTNDILERLKAYKILFIDYKNDEDYITYYTKNESVTIRRKYEEYEIYLNKENWDHVFDVYISIDKFKLLIGKINLINTI